ncbi:unnamed protein product [Gongylonema pulchrum]|uniref:RPAP3_C domain-containing protein n=1 Tax=Gongylonema pulchrum TaxID=637853 RepID=A0A183E2T7_9BILA|nr:unnamed protein product [Gongylonema pulchrum]
MESGEASRQEYAPSPRPLNDFDMAGTRFKELNDSYAQTRSERIRAAMFPDLCGDASTHPPPPSRSSIVTSLSEPSQLLTTAVIELLSLQDETELTTKAIPELVKLLSDKDEV